MSTTSDWLSSEILDFIAVLNRCLAETTFVQDRRLYADDIAAATAWLVRLKKGGEASTIATEILEPATTKQFTDYWRQGVWGEIESKALSTLKDRIRERYEQ